MRLAFREGGVLRKSFCVGMTAIALVTATIGSVLAAPPTGHDEAEICFNSNNDPSPATFGAELICDYQVKNQLARYIFSESPRTALNLWNFPRILNNLVMVTPASYVFNDLIQGTDLGISASTPNGDLYFYGDTGPSLVPARPGQGERWATGYINGLPIGIDANKDRKIDGVLSKKDGVAGLSAFIYGYNAGEWNYVSTTPFIGYEDVLFFEQGAFFQGPSGFLNGIERYSVFKGEWDEYPTTDFHWQLGEYPELELPFHVPVGAVVIPNQSDEDEIYLWMGKYINHTGCDQSHLGLVRPNGSNWDFRYFGLFAEQKFIQIAAYTIDAQEYEEPAADECGLPWEPGQDKGIVVYGTGDDRENDYNGYAKFWATENYEDESTEEAFRYCKDGAEYRVSNLYLAFIDPTEMKSPFLDDSDKDLRSRVWYYVGPDHVADLANADVPINPGDYSDDGCWYRGPFGESFAQKLLDHSYGERWGLGEQSVMRLPIAGSLPGEKRLVLWNAARYGYSSSLQIALDERQSPIGFNRNINVSKSQALLGMADISRPWDLATQVTPGFHLGYGNYLAQSSFEVQQIDTTAGPRHLLWFDRVVSPWAGPAGGPESYGSTVVRSVLILEDFVDL